MSENPLKEVILSSVKKSRDGLEIVDSGIPRPVAKKKPKPPKSMGRPKGSLNKVNATLKLILAENGEKVLKTVLKKAFDADDKDQATMLKIVMERLMPATKAIDITSTEKSEQDYTISVEGVSVHNGQVIDAETVEFLEHEEDKEEGEEE